MDAGHTAGSASGAVLGLYKGISMTASSLAILSWGVVLDTLVLGAAGGVGGWLVVEVLKLIKDQLKKIKNDKASN